MTLCRTYHVQRVTARTVSHLWFGVVLAKPLVERVCVFGELMRSE